VAPCDCPDDPPDLEFYRIRAFVLGKSGRVAAHALDYVPSPSAVVYSPGYGRQPLWYGNVDVVFGPFLTHIQAPYDPTRAVSMLYCLLLSNLFNALLIG